MSSAGTVLLTTLVLQALLAQGARAGYMLGVGIADVTGPAAEVHFVSRRVDVGQGGPACGLPCVTGAASIFTYFFGSRPHVLPGQGRMAAEVECVCSLHHTRCCNYPV